MTRVYVSVGSNIDKENNIRAALTELRGRYGDLTVSSVYESEPVGLKGDHFYNLVVAFDTDQLPAAVASTLRAIESRRQRIRREERFVSRTLDLDLLLYGDAVVREAGLTIPRDEVTSCAYVLRPLAEVAGDERHPVTRRRFADLWECFDKSSQAIWPVPMATQGGQ